MRTSPAFKIGDRVVYPNHGIGIIESIQEASTGRINKFYRLRLMANDSTVMVPMANISQVGLRRIITKKEIHQVFGVLKERDISVTRD